MESYWFVIPVSACVAFALLGPFVLHLRKELMQGWSEVIGSAGEDDSGPSKQRMEALRNAEPMGWTMIAALTAIVIVICFAFGFAVVYDGALLRVACVAIMIALVVLFNAILFAQFPPSTDPPEA